jgi:coenzyme F420 hydrogenase subunit beta
MESVVEPGLCSGCGLCAAACEGGAITMGDIATRCEPMFDPSRCTACGRCLAVCPGAGIDLLGAGNERFGEPSYSLLGKTRRIGTAHAGNPDIRAAGASGGVVTAMLEHLLASGMADRAIVLGFDEEKPYLTRYRVVETPDEARNCSRSKYSVNHLGDVLRNAKGRLAVVTLPCQTHGLIRWSRLKESCPRIEWVLGLYCGGALPFEATRIMLSKMGIRDLSRIRTLKYRAGPWPGFFEATLSSGEVRRVPKAVFDAVSFSHTLPRCHLCTDETNEFADLSFADSWNLSGHGRAGETLVLARSSRGEELLGKCVASGAIRFSPVDAEDAVRMHAHHIARRKVGAFRRMRIREIARLPNPDYGVEYTGRIGTGELIREKGLIFLSTSRTVANVTRLLPAAILGPATRVARKAWNLASRIALPSRWEVRPRHG